MNTFPWNNYDKWLTRTPDDMGHKTECTCGNCHEAHKQDCMVAEYSTLLYHCCVDEFDQMVLEKRACKKHPLAYHELNYCEDCENENQ